MDKTVSLIISAALVIALGVIFFGSEKSDTAGSAGSNIEIRDGVQYVMIHAHNGYDPKVSYAQAGIPTKLIVETDGTYDCSADLRINDIGYQKILGPVGEEVIDAGVLAQGKTLEGGCGMGMYGFKVQFN